MMIVVTTVLSADDGVSLAEKLVRAKLAACVQILPQMTSVYAWEGKVQKGSEHLLIIKTLAEKFDEVAAFITANHGYDVPEIVAIESARISDAYLSWINETLA